MAKFDAVKKSFVYYGDISNNFLHYVTNAVIPDDIETRLDALETLKSYSAADFNQNKYNAVSTTGYLTEALADTFSGTLSLLGIGSRLISTVAPDMAHYWAANTHFGSELRQRLTDQLKAAFDNDDEIMLVSHSLGSIISYDCLWKFSHYGEYRQDYGANKKIDLLVTLGSPLADENVKKQLKGNHHSGKLKYPHNINNWVNIAAEDDYIAHDSRIDNDYKAMYAQGLLHTPIRDIYPIYNLTVRNNKSNPHSSIGYLINPSFVKVVNDWLE